jgi:hypothetical protein
LANLSINHDNVLWSNSPYLVGYYRNLAYQEPVFEYPGAEITSSLKMGGYVELTMKSTDARDVIAEYYSNLLLMQGWEKDYDVSNRIVFSYRAVFFKRNYIINNDMYDVWINFEEDGERTVIILKKTNYRAIF